MGQLLEKEGASREGDMGGATARVYADGNARV